MLALVSALVLLGSDPSAVTAERSRQYFKDYHLFCAPDTICHGFKAPVPVSGPGRTWGGTFTFQEGPTTPQVKVYAGPLDPAAAARLALTKKR